MSNIIEMPKKKEHNIVIVMDDEQNIEGIQAPSGLKKSDIIGLLEMAKLMVADEFQ